MTFPSRLVDGKAVTVSCGECDARSVFVLAPNDRLNVRHVCGMLPAFELRYPQTENEQEPRS